MGPARNADFRHLPHVEHFIDLGVRQNLLPLHQLPDEHVFLYRLLAELGRPRVADLRSESRRQRGRALEPEFALLAIGFDSPHRFFREDAGGVAEDLHRQQNVVRDDRHHDVQLELPVLGRNADACIVADYLEADLIDHLRYRWIHLARHNRRTGLNRGKADLIESGARAAREQAQVARDLAQVEGEDSELRAEARDISHALHQLHAIFTDPQIDLGGGAQLFDHESRIRGLDVNASADSAAANPEIAQVISGFDDSLERAPERSGVTAELLSEADRHRVLQMRAAGFEHSVEFFCLRFERSDQVTDRLLESAQLGETRQPNRRRNHVIGRLRHVDVIVRVHGSISPPLLAEYLVRAISEDLVAVHVVRRARAGLIDIDDEVLAVLAR